jgi:phytol kinase
MTAVTWLRIALLLAGFVAMFAILALPALQLRGTPEGSRKLLHVGSGVLTLTFPFVFDSTAPVLVLTMVAAGIMAAVRVVRPLRERFGRVALGVQRTSYGDLYFPFAIAVVSWATQDRHPLLFVIPVLTLTFADAAGALVGGRLGRIRYVGSDKTIAGSLAFGAVAFVCTYLPLAAVTDLSPSAAASIAWIVATSTAVVEACCRRGADNLMVPLAGYALLEACLALPPSALAAQSIMTTALGGLLCLQTFWCSRRAIPIH